MREKPTQEFVGPKEAGASLLKREAGLPTGDSVKRFTIFLTTLLALHGSAEARKPGAHEELMSMLPKFNPADLQPNGESRGLTPEGMAKEILALKELVSEAQERFGGKHAWADHTFAIDEGPGREQQIADSLPPEGTVLVLVDREIHIEDGSRLEDPRQYYKSSNGIVEIGKEVKVVPSGEETTVIGYGATADRAIVNALTTAAQNAPRQKSPRAAREAKNLDWCFLKYQVSRIGKDDRGGFLVEIAVEYVGIAGQ
ncbi:hypothetical protein GYA13_03530 [Candidatus Kuenenbacteria bacterium]|nr:hypothetical protein [Candidatus Kuenenbacteria bacterium]